MIKIYIIAPQLTYVINWLKEQKLPREWLHTKVIHLHGGNNDKTRGIEHGTHFVVIARPTNYGQWEELQVILKQRQWKNLPLTVNDWPVEVFQ